MTHAYHEESPDGKSQINLFNYNGSWIISARSNIGASCKWFSNKTFEELFQDSSNNLDREKLDSNVCYTLVLILIIE